MPLILFTSPKGGVGKTTLAAHVAAILAARGNRVLALDLDPQNSLRLHLGFPMREQSGFMAGLGQGADWRSSVLQSPTGLRLLPFGAANSRRVFELSGALLSHPELLTAPVREMLAEPGLIVIADTPPGPSTAVAALAGIVEMAVVVMLADAGSASLIPQVVSGQAYGRGTLANRFVERTAVVLNQVDLDSTLSATVLDTVAKMLGPRLIGAVCRDEAVAEALAHRRLLTTGVGGAVEDLGLLADAVSERLALPSPGRRQSSFSALADWGIT